LNNLFSKFNLVSKKQVKVLKSFKFKEEVKIMEVCGTHTASIHKNGIHKLLPENVKLVSGPGCPVCVTPAIYINEAISLARKGYTIVTFGDMIRVPGTNSSLEKERAEGADIRVVFSPLDAIDIANKIKNQTVFLSVGFETTVPCIAISAMQALKKNIDNFTLLTGNKIIPPAMITLIESGSQIDGFLLPGHVSTILGKTGYRFLERYKIPGVIAGFESLDILSSIIILLKMIQEKRRIIINNYRRAVRDNGNTRSLSIINEVFSKEDSEWRGLGTIKKSGLKLKGKYKKLNIRRKIKLDVEKEEHNPLCKCGDVLRGLIDPPACTLFKVTCTPDNPIGPCMVSSEGSCSAWYKYG
jgi:hydrogenase expression/formation protein HypD